MDPNPKFDIPYIKPYCQCDYHHFWKQMSNNQLTLDVTTVDWIMLPHDHSDYFPSGVMPPGGLDDAGRFLLPKDCIETAVAANAVDFSQFPGITQGDNYSPEGTIIVTIFSALLEADDASTGLSATLRGGRLSPAVNVVIDGQDAYYRTALISERAYKTGPGVIAHEIGHLFGLAHSAGHNNDAYESRWDVMSDASNGCTVATPYNMPAVGGPSFNATWGCIPVGTSSYQDYLLNWFAPNQQIIVSPGSQITVTLSPLLTTANTTYYVALIPIPGSTDFYAVEARTSTVGYDEQLPFANISSPPVVVIHRVKPNQHPESFVIDIDTIQTTSTGDPLRQYCWYSVSGDVNQKSAWFDLNEIFYDTNGLDADIAVKVVSITTTSATVQITVNPDLYSGLGCPA